MIEIIIPVYNNAELLDRALGSLSAQTDPNFQIRIIDDCSTENLIPVVDKYSNLHIEYIRNEKNLRCGMSRMVGVNTTNAEYIAFLDSDDILMPYTIGFWNMLVKQRPEIDMWHGYFYQQHGSNMILEKYGSQFCHAKLFKTELFKKYGITCYPEIQMNDDSVLTAQFMELGKVEVVTAPLYIWMENPNSFTRGDEHSEWIIKHSVDDFLLSRTLAYKNITKYKTKGLTYLKSSFKFFEQHKKEVKNMANYCYLKNLIKADK